MEILEEIKSARAYREINLKNLESNVELIRTRLQKDTKIMAVVKADAYGHGAVEVSRRLNKMGIYDFCVASLSEAIELRENKIEGNILILGFTSLEHIKYLLKYDLSQTIIDLDYGRRIDEIAKDLGGKIRCHVKLDTGMHRLGENSSIDRIAKIYELENLDIWGSFSHFAAADGLDGFSKDFTRMQIEKFNYIIESLRNRNIDVGKVHLQNSDGFLHYEDLNYDYIRLGIAMYGLMSDSKDFESLNLGLKPVMSLKSRLGLIRELEKGESIGYGMTYKSEKAMKIGVVPLGYGDGLPRILSNRGEVLVKGKSCKILGRICMDQCIIDLSGVQANLYDEVVFIGDSENTRITTMDMAAGAETIANEILVSLSERLGRIYVEA